MTAAAPAVLAPSTAPARSPPQQRKRPYATRRPRRPPPPPSDDEEVGGFISSSTDDETPHPASSGGSVSSTTETTTTTTTNTKTDCQHQQRRPPHKRPRVAASQSSCVPTQDPSAGGGSGGGGGVMDDDDAFRSFFESAGGSRGPSVFSRARVAARIGSGSGSSGNASAPGAAGAATTMSSQPQADVPAHDPLSLAHDQATPSSASTQHAAIPTVQSPESAYSSSPAQIPSGKTEIPETAQGQTKRRLAGELSDSSDSSDDDDDDENDDNEERSKTDADRQRRQRGRPLLRGNSASQLGAKSAATARASDAPAAEVGRELSLTPPPDLTARDLAIVYSIRQTLDDMGKHYKPKPQDSPFGREPAHAPRIPGEPHVPEHHQPTRPARDTLLPLPTEAVLVTVEFSRYPALPTPPLPITVRINMVRECLKAAIWDQPFDRLMTVACATYAIDRERCIFVYRGTPVFPRATAHAVRMQSEAVLYLYYRVEYDRMRAALMQPAPTPLPPMPTLPSDAPAHNALGLECATTNTIGDHTITVPAPPPPSSSSPPPPSAAADTTEHVLIKLAHLKLPHLKLKVPASRTMADLVAAFTAHHAQLLNEGGGAGGGAGRGAAAVQPLPPGMVFRIVFEGDTVPMDESLADAGVEDGDVLETFGTAQYIRLFTATEATTSPFALLYLLRNLKKSVRNYFDSTPIGKWSITELLETLEERGALNYTEITKNGRLFEANDIKSAINSCLRSISNSNICLKVVRKKAFALLTTYTATLGSDKVSTILGRIKATQLNGLKKDLAHELRLLKKQDEQIRLLEAQNSHNADSRSQRERESDGASNDDSDDFSSLTSLSDLPAADTSSRRLAFDQHRVDNWRHDVTYADAAAASSSEVTKINEQEDAETAKCDTIASLCGETNTLRRKSEEVDALAIVTLEGREYFSADDLFSVLPNLFAGCNGKPRAMLKVTREDGDFLIPEHVFAQKTKNALVLSQASYSLAKLFISCHWVKGQVGGLSHKRRHLQSPSPAGTFAQVADNQMDSNSEDNDNKQCDGDAPALLQLEENEKLRDSAGNVVNIETRGERCTTARIDRGLETEVHLAAAQNTSASNRLLLYAAAFLPTLELAARIKGSTLALEELEDADSETESEVHQRFSRTEESSDDTASEAEPVSLITPSAAAPAWKAAADAAVSVAPTSSQE
ncbi:hypothetical protein HDU86_007487 [Geranomyces michiganensis]|nr:hypothetical protein HDU86_007487 [Geranomyces michiganensis]